MKDMCAFVAIKVTFSSLTVAFLDVPAVDTASLLAKGFSTPLLGFERHACCSLSSRKGTEFCVYLTSPFYSRFKSSMVCFCLDRCLR